MKRKALHIVTGWLLLAAFLFAQLPFSAFHDHEHAPACELTTQPQTPGGDKAHFHSYEDEYCFVCSACILKKDYSHVSFSAAPVQESLSKILQPHYEEHIISRSSFKVSRGPPSSFLL